MPSCRSCWPWGVGGVILLGGSAAELALRTRQLQTWADQPLLLCADVEEGVGQRFEGASWLVPPLALGRLHRRDPERALALAERYGRCCGQDCPGGGAQLGAGAGVRCEQQPRQSGDQRARLGRGPPAPEPWRGLPAGVCRAQGCSAAPSTFPATATPAAIPTWSCPCCPTAASDSSRWNCPPSARPLPPAWIRRDDRPPHPAGPRSPRPATLSGPCSMACCGRSWALQAWW
jgi:beta-glucosidase